MAGEDFSTQQLGESEDVIPVHTLAEIATACDAMAAQARHSLCILSPDTEPELYGRQAFADILAALIARRSKVASIRMLVRDPRRASREPHRLVDLSHRFPSFVAIRQLRDVWAQNDEAFLLVDDIGLIRRAHHDNPAGVVTFRNLGTARERATWFENAWEHATPCQELRRVRL